MVSTQALPAMPCASMESGPCWWDSTGRGGGGHGHGQMKDSVTGSTTRLVAVGDPLEGALLTEVSGPAGRPCRMGSAALTRGGRPVG